MTTPARATDDARGRFYTWLQRKYVSVTTILSALGKPALPNWAAKTVAEFAIRQHKQVYAILQESGEDAAIRFLKGRPWAERDTAADIGSTVHKAIDMHILGQEYEWPEKAKGHERQFNQWLAEYEPTFELSEATVYHRKPAYAGTLDSILTLPNGRRYLVDVKSGKNVYGEVALQLAAYRYADFIGLPDGTEHEVPPVDGAAVLHLRPNDHEFLEIRAGEDEYRVFLYVMACWRWLNGGQDGAVGAEVER